jgi:hypothetical protein
MPEALDALRRADQAAGAADVDLALLRYRLAAAFRAMVGEDVGRALLVAGGLSTTCGMTSPARWMRTVAFTQAAAQSRRGCEASRSAQ